MRPMSTREARRVAASRKTFGGPARKPAYCPKCGKKCQGTRVAREHCRAKAA